LRGDEVTDPLVLVAFVDHQLLDVLAKRSGGAQDQVEVGVNEAGASVLLVLADALVPHLDEEADVGLEFLLRHVLATVRTMKPVPGGRIRSTISRKRRRSFSLPMRRLMPTWSTVA